MLNVVVLDITGASTGRRTRAQVSLEGKDKIATS
jgi:hypothetical protein